MRAKRFTSAELRKFSTTFIVGFPHGQAFPSAPNGHICISVLSPVNVIMEFIVASVGQVDAEAGPYRIEDLHGGVDPDLGQGQALEVGRDVIEDSLG